MPLPWLSCTVAVSVVVAVPSATTLLEEEVSASESVTGVAVNVIGAETRALLAPESVTEIVSLCAVLDEIVAVKIPPAFVCPLDVALLLPAGENVFALPDAASVSD